MLDRARPGGADPAVHRARARRPAASRSPPITARRSSAPRCRPMTLEAEILHFADNASAKTASMAAALARPTTSRGGAGERALALAARPAARLPWRQRLGRRSIGPRVEKRNGRLVVARRPSHVWTIRGRGIAAAVLLPPATGWLIRRSGGRGRASVSIPRPDGHPTWFVHSSAASQIGSRTDRSHCTPRRKIGVDEARDWLHLFKPG